MSRATIAVLADVEAERIRQDARLGSAEAALAADDRLDPSDWIALTIERLGRIRGYMAGGDTERARSSAVSVAAVAVAFVEALDRRGPVE